MTCINYTEEDTLNNAVGKNSESYRVYASQLTPWRDNMSQQLLRDMGSLFCHQKKIQIEHLQTTRGGWDR